MRLRTRPLLVTSLLTSLIERGAELWLTWQGFIPFALPVA